MVNLTTYYFLFYLYMLTDWILIAVTIDMAEQMHFSNENGTCYGASKEILVGVPYGMELAERYKSYGRLFQQVVCAFTFGFSYYKLRITYLMRKYYLLFLVATDGVYAYDRKSLAPLLLKMIVLLFSVFFIIGNLFSNHRNPVHVIMTAANTQDPNFIISCLHEHYDEERCSIIYSYQEHKANMLTNVTFWMVILIVLSGWRAVMLEQAPNARQPANPDQDEDDEEPFFFFV